MSSHHYVIETISVNKQASLCEVSTPLGINEQSPALHVFEDFSVRPPLLVPEDMDYVHLKDVFQSTHRHYVLVEGRSGKLTGLVSVEDVLGPRSMIKAYECGSSVRDQTARDLMIPVSVLPAISQIRARKAQVGDIVSTMKRLSVSVLLVTKDGETIEGVFSLKTISAVLPLELSNPLRAGSVAEIAQAINGHYPKV